VSASLQHFLFEAFLWHREHLAHFCQKGPIGGMTAAVRNSLQLGSARKPFSSRTLQLEYYLAMGKKKRETRWFVPSAAVKGLELI